MADEILITIFSVSTAVFSIALAIIAMWQANSARKETQANSNHVSLVLKDIEANSNSIREDVSKNMQDMQSNISDTQKGLMEMQKSMNDVFTQRVMADIPQRVSPQDEFTMGLAKNIFDQHPELLTELIKQAPQSQNMDMSKNEGLKANLLQKTSKEMSSDEKE
ncbi:MAG: hypothetical protein K8E24_012360 [Methanobacterium paludis]|nr:hypothetical protein [Methanobacterium paludis]